jgi:probable F420-dependent oxidoreductase
VKVRVGFGIGGNWLPDPPGYGPLVEDLERLGFDSLWLTERVTGPTPEPLVALAYAAARTRKLKLGIGVLVLPGRNPVVLAEAMASVDALSGGRLLPAVGLGAVDPAEQAASGVAREDRAAWFDEALPLIRRLWVEEDVSHHGPRFSLDGVTVRPRPVQDPIEVWLGGRAPSELRRAGRMGDGWLPSFCTPAEVAEGRVVVEEAAARAGREIDPEHFGAYVTYVEDGAELPARTQALLARRHPGVDPADVVPTGPAALRRQLERFVDVGFSKFVVVPARTPAGPDALEALAAEVLPLHAR